MFVPPFFFFPSSSSSQKRMHKILILLLLFLHNRNACRFGLHTLCCCLLLSSLELGLNKTVIITKEVAEDRKKKKKKYDPVVSNSDKWICVRDMIIAVVILTGSGSLWRSPDDDYDDVVVVVVVVAIVLLQQNLVFFDIPIMPKLFEWRKKNCQKRKLLKKDRLEQEKWVGAFYLSNREICEGCLFFSSRKPEEVRIWEKMRKLWAWKDDRSGAS